MKQVFSITIVIIILVMTQITIGYSQTNSAGLYKLGINDVINIKVQGHEDLSFTTPISIDGTISFPNLGSIYVKDKTLAEVEEEITRKLAAGYIKSPVVTIYLHQSSSKRVYIHGELGRTGAIPFEKDMTVVMALSLAGGIRDTGLYGTVKVRRAGEGRSGYKTIGESGLDKGIIKNKNIEDMLLKSDDIVIVERSNTIFVQGEIVTSGRLELEDGMTVLRALSMAGSIRESGLYGKVKVRRIVEGSKGYKTVGESGLHKGNIKNKAIEDMLLQPDDILIVERSETFFIQGEVSKAGQYILEDDMTVSRAIAVAGGITDKGGLYGKVKVKRKRGVEFGYETVGESGLKKGIIKREDIEDMLLQPDDIVTVERNETVFVAGEVTLPGQYVLEDEMTVSRSITLAGGIKDAGQYGKVKVRRMREDGPGFNDMEIDIKGIIDGTVQDDLLLKPDDIVIVERSKEFLMYGEVNKVGVFPLEKDITVMKALTMAGGLTKWGSESRVKVLRKTGDGKRLEIINVNINEVLKGNAEADMNLQPDDIVMVSTRIF
jgi:protein involved in polysaccharide export with SLBB domain